jgi:hypothetical protein
MLDKDINLEKFNPVNPLGETPVEQEIEEDQRIEDISDEMWDTLERESPQKKSQRAAREHLADPGIPILLPIEYSIVSNYLLDLIPELGRIASKDRKEPTEAQKIINQTMIETSNKLLERWSKDIADLKKKQEAQYDASMLDATYRQYDSLKTHLEKVLHEVGKEKDVNQDQQVFELMSMFLVGAGLASTALHTIAVGSVEFSHLTGIQQIQHVMMNVIPDEQFRAELGLIGALFGASAIYRTTWVTLMEGQGAAGSGKKKNAAFARNYAKDIEKLVTSTKLDNFVLVSCMKMERGQGKPAVTEERLRQLAAIIKLVHLVSALAVIYWIETKHITPEEIADMMNGKMQLPEKDPRLPLIKLVQQQLKLIPPDEKKRVLQGLFDYLDSKPKVDDLLEPGIVFDNLNAFISGAVQG